MRNLVFLLAASVIALFALPAQADETVFKLEFDQPSSPSSAKVAEEMALIIAERLGQRFKAAGVKDFKIRPHTRDLSVTVGGDFDPGWLMGVATAPGALEIRQVVEGGGPDWRSLTDMLPADVEIRGETARGYLWSATRSPLDRVLSRLSMATELKMVVAPDVLGWRTITVGEPLLDETDIARATKSLAPTGTFNVSLALEPKARARLAARTSNGLQTWAVILDDEVVSLVPRLANDSQILGIAAPDRLGTNIGGQSLWASAIVGRLAAPMPVRLALFKEK